MAQQAQMLLSLLAETAQFSKEQTRLLQRIINTAYLEGRLDRIKEEYEASLQRSNNYGKDNTIQHHS